MDNKKISDALRALGVLKESNQPNNVSTEPVSGAKPNILFILVDEMRFPSFFPKGIENADQFLRKYMPNVHSLWKKGVKFSNYHTAASACTPARGTIITGLYSQQTWLGCTLTQEPYTLPDLPSMPDPGNPPKAAPTLSPVFPTYGKLLRETANYRTPYIGKWHVSILNPNEKGLGLESYGFDGKVYPDPIAYNLQGTVGFQPEFPSDLDTANAAVNWFNIENERYKTYPDYNPKDEPWCLTVGFVNPHDREFFWAGTEIEKYNEFTDNAAFINYGQQSGSGAPPIRPADNPLKNPPKIDYPTTPPNWESNDQMEANKPSTQYMMRNFQACTWGGASSDATETEFVMQEYPGKKPLPYGIAEAPYSYWERGMDSYTQVMREVDKHIGEVLRGFNTLPDDVIENTIVVFASDHGDYSGAHGFLSGKMGSVYKEAYNIPLIVVDNSDRFTAETDIIRDEFVSSVDLLRMFVGFGNLGSQNWLNGDLAKLYGNRLNVLPLLESAEAKGRDYLLLVTDELIPGFMNFNSAPMHIIGLLTKAGKLGTYSQWVPKTDKIIMSGKDDVEIEYYDYRLPGGKLELTNEANNPLVAQLTDLLLNVIVPNELRQELPEGILRKVNVKAKQEYLGYEEAIAEYTLITAIQGSSDDDQDTTTETEDTVQVVQHAFGRSF